jgi:transposase
MLIVRYLIRIFIKNIFDVKYCNHKKNICPHLPFGNSWGNTKVKLYQVVKAILYRLKTGCQWRQIPLKQFFRTKYSWNSVYSHYRKWCKDGCWQKLWQSLLQKYKSLLDMSSVQLDGTHTPAKRGGEAVAYQGRKSCKTSNMLILSDVNGIPIACSEPIAGNHNDAFELVKNFENMTDSLQKSGISFDGLFLNADAGFDSRPFRNCLYKHDIIDNIDQNKRNGKNDVSFFDDQLYKQRFVIERTNAWLDAFKAILVRFETKKSHWKALNIIAFTIILLRQL